MKNCNFKHCPFQFEGHCCHSIKHLDCQYAMQEKEIKKLRKTVNKMATNTVKIAEALPKLEEELKTETVKEFEKKINNAIDFQLNRFSEFKKGEFTIICQILRGLKNNVYNLSKEILEEEV